MRFWTASLRPRLLRRNWLSRRTLYSLRDRSLLQMFRKLNHEDVVPKTAMRWASKPPTPLAALSAERSIYANQYSQLP